MSQQNINPIHISCKVNGVPSDIVLWGQSDKLISEIPEEVIILLPGNPGCTPFYNEYLRHLHKMTNLPVWIIGHAGHSTFEPNNPYKDLEIPPLKGSEHLYNLQGQLKHKEEFLLRFTKSTTKVHLLGHSAGAWIAAELLKNQSLEKRIASVNLLFPTLENIGQMPNAFWVNQILRNITCIMVFLTFVFECLPSFLQALLIFIYLRICRQSQNFAKYVLSFLKASIVENVLFMAYDEMDSIKALDAQNIAENLHRIKIVYADDDGWAPGEIFRRMQNDMPQLYIRRVNFRHTFVIHESKEMAEVTKKLIKNEDF